MKRNENALLAYLLLFPIALMGATNEPATITITIDDPDELLPESTNAIFLTNGTWFCMVHPTNALQRGYAPFISETADTVDGFYAGSSNHPNAFPYSRKRWVGIGSDRQDKEVLFCSACRQAREKWLKTLDLDPQKSENNLHRTRSQNQPVDRTR